MQNNIGTLGGRGGPVNAPQGEEHFRASGSERFHEAQAWMIGKSGSIQFNEQLPGFHSLKARHRLVLQLRPKLSKWKTPYDQ
jgi:hypothetical protein